MHAVTAIGDPYATQRFEVSLFYNLNTDQQVQVWIL